MNAEALAANAHVDVDVPLLGPGGTLQALADVTSDVTITALSGVLFS
jgi:accessory colonization factor AcfC